MGPSFPVSTSVHVASCCGPLVELMRLLLCSSCFSLSSGGDNISVTMGVVSRVEPTQYAHSASQLLAIQIDAAINPGNSGGPALVRAPPTPSPSPHPLLPPQEQPNDSEAEEARAAEACHDEAPAFRVAGVAFQNLSGAENIG